MDDVHRTHQAVLADATVKEIVAWARAGGLALDTSRQRLSLLAAS